MHDYTRVQNSKRTQTTKLNLPRVQLVEAVTRTDCYHSQLGCNDPCVSIMYGHETRTTLPQFPMPHKKVGCLRMHKQQIPSPFSWPGYEARVISAHTGFCTNSHSCFPFRSHFSFHFMGEKMSLLPLAGKNPCVAFRQKVISKVACVYRFTNSYQGSYFLMGGAI